MVNKGQKTDGKVFDGLSGRIGLKNSAELKAAAKHSADGFLAVLFGEKAFRTDLAIFLICVCIAVFLPRLSWCERALMIYVVFFPLVAELTNTAIEKTVDRISTDYHRLSGLVKDIGSTLVAASFVGAGICWLVIMIGWTCRMLGA